MRRIAAFCFLLAFTVPLSSVARGQDPNAEERTSQAAEKAEKKEQNSVSVWAWANFVLLAGGLGYLTAKKGGPYFKARSMAIRKNLLESQELLAEAEARMTVVEERLARLQADIDTLRAEAMAENEAEIEHVRKLAASETAKIQTRAEQEIANAGRSARLELKRYAASLAIESAGQKLRARITPQDQDALIASFTERLEHPASRAQSST